MGSLFLETQKPASALGRASRRIWLTAKGAATGNIGAPLPHIFSDDKNLGPTKAGQRRSHVRPNALSVPIRPSGDQQGPPSMPAIAGGVGSRPAAGEAAKRMPYLQSIITIVGAADLADMGTPLQTRRSFFRISFHCPW